MYKIDENYVSCARLLTCTPPPKVCGAGIKIHNYFEINCHNIFLNIKLTGCPILLTFVSLM